MAVSTAQGSVAPGSSHVADPTLRPFLQARFDPADYLNTTLPSLALSTPSSRPSKQATAVTLGDLSSHTQDLLSQLNAHTTRLSTVLTQLADDILRSGGRLAYEVEVLRGETIGLTETLTDRLKSDIKKFLPGGISPEVEESEDSVKGPEGEDNQLSKAEAGTNKLSNTEIEPSTPPYISQLRTLTLVRSRLESVIKVFGDAMQWTLPPSDVSLASSLISVSAPEPGSDSHSREEKGREFAENLRSEISELVTGNASEESGFEAAMMRIQALRDLAQVWKGTAEEKARVKFVENLAKLAEDKQKALDVAANQRQHGGRSGSIQKSQAKEKSHGFLDNIQRMRGNIYLE